MSRLVSRTKRTSSPLQDTIIEVMKILGACEDSYIEGAVCRKLRRVVGELEYHDAWKTLVANGVARRVETCRGVVYEYAANPQPQSIPWDSENR